MGHDFHVLLIEDSQADVKIIERALTDGKIPYRLTVLQDGQHALGYLVQLGDEVVPLDQKPDLVLLHLNPPGIDGYRILTRIKNHSLLRTVPVVVLTTSGREEDISRTYQAEASGFIQKPAEYPRDRDLVKTLQNYWHESAVGPPPDRPTP
ncbi:MAG: response regulator [Isosphaeraceae bacterium]